LCTYILFVVFSSTSILQVLTGTSIPNSPILTYLVAFLIMPIISFIFILAAHNMQTSPFPDLKDVYKKAIIFMLAIGVPICVVLMLPSLAFVSQNVGMPELVTAGLVAISLPLAIQYHKIAKTNYNAEDAIPNFIREVTESQKIGLSPEKSIIEATKVKEYGQFSQSLDLVRSQIEWGIPLRKTFENIRQKIRSWFVTLNFAMMIETVEIGGNSTQALEILSEYSEKEHEIQINRRALLRPYIILAFIWSILIAVTTTIVALTTYLMSSVVSSSLSPIAIESMQSQMQVYSVGIIIQCWISGFFIGKISEGNIAAGFKHSAMLAVTAYVSLVMSQIFLAGMFKIPT